MRKSDYGAAIATVLGQFVTAILALWYLFHMNLVQPAHKDFQLSSHVIGKTLVPGVTSLLLQISLVAAIMLIVSAYCQLGLPSLKSEKLKYEAC